MRCCARLLLTPREKQPSAEQQQRPVTADSVEIYTTGNPLDVPADLVQDFLPMLVQVSAPHGSRGHLKPQNRDSK
jgi:hypothetical protein